jgi:hypothetical protein
VVSIKQFGCASHQTFRSVYPVCHLRCTIVIEYSSEYAVQYRIYSTQQCKNRSQDVVGTAGPSTPPPLKRRGQSANADDGGVVWVVVVGPSSSSSSSSSRDVNTAAVVVERESGCNAAAVETAWPVGHCQ